MNVLALPPSPEALAKARWEDIAPYFDELAELPLEVGTIEAWLRSWSTLEELVTDPHVNCGFYKDRTREWVSVSGTARVTQDKQIILHCKSGADRAGFVAALYLIVHEGRSVDEALRQLSARYGHFRFSKTGILDAFFERYAEIRAISDGFFEERRDLYNLYPLLVHVSFFGGGYLESVRTTLRRLGL